MEVKARREWGAWSSFHVYGILPAATIVLAGIVATMILAFRYTNDFGAAPPYFLPLYVGYLGGFLWFVGYLGFCLGRIRRGHGVGARR